MAAPVAPASALDVDEATETADTGMLWDRLRAMTPPLEMLLAPKADRATRALMIQDSDPMLLFALLKNPRLGTDEVVRVAKSSYLGFQAAELILKTAQWSGNLDLRAAMIHNPKGRCPWPAHPAPPPGLRDATDRQRRRDQRRAQASRRLCAEWSAADRRPVAQTDDPVEACVSWSCSTADASPNHRARPDGSGGQGQ